MILKFTRTSLLMLTFILTISVAKATGDEKGSRNATTSKNQKAQKEDLKLSSTGVIYYDAMNVMNDTTSLEARGYHIFYRGTGPQGTTAVWYQGIATVFTAYEGPDTGYVAANYNVVTGTNTIDSWLVLPALNITMGDTLSFWSRSPDGSTFADSIRVMYSAAGDTLPEATTWVELGNFKVSTSGWEYNEFLAPTSGANGRFAIRYNVSDAGPNGSNSNYIGIDQIMVTGPSGTGINELENISLNISPNPATDKVTVKVGNYIGSKMEIKILNLLGQEVKREEVSINNSEINAVIDISGIKKGSYLIILSNGTDKLTQKLIIE